MLEYRHIYKKMLETKIVNSIKDIPRDSWQRLFSNQIESRGLYETAEDTNIGPFKYCYLLVLKDKQVKCILPMFSMNFDIAFFTSGKVWKIINSLRKFYKSFLCFKMFLCGSPIADNGFLNYDKDLNRQELVDIILKELISISKKNKASIGFKDFSNESSLLDLLLNKGFIKVLSYPCVIQRLPGNCLEDFFESLPVSRRYNLRRKIKKIKSLPALNLEVKDSLTDEELDRIFELYMNTYKRSAIHFEKLDKDFFIKIQENMKGQLKFFIYKAEDKIIGFNLCFLKNDLFLDKFLGFDYSYLYKYQLFFNRWFLNVAWCYKNGFKIYQSGQTGYDGKMLLAGRLRPLYIYGKHRNNFINFLLKPIFLVFQPKNFDSVFKLLPEYEYKGSA